MNRFSRTAIADYDPDKEAQAQDLNVQARKLIESGVLSERDYRACITLADLRKLVAAALPQAPDVLQARAAVLREELEENPALDRALAIIDELAEITNAMQRDGERLSDYGDARREAKFGEAL